VWSELGRFKKKDKQNLPIIGVVGCMAEVYKEKIFEKAPHVDFVVGPNDIAKIPFIIKSLIVDKNSSLTNDLFEKKFWETDGEERPEDIYHTGYYENEKHAYVIISEGCSNLCSYCVVPYVRGPLKNRNYKSIIKEIEEAIEIGREEITLLGQNVNAYYYEDVDFVELVELVNSIKGLKNFSFITSHPKDTTLRLFKVMAECEKLKKYLHLPVQSGSNRILELMNRQYTIEFYLDLVEKYRKFVKGGILTTDIIVGFPSETEEDFYNTVRIVQTVKFDAAYIFKYSARPYTHAASFKDDVPLKEKEKRHQFILQLQKSISQLKKTSDVILT
ncbi:MAG: MiaB/RimO family radical SAM methylthiotransferase, partial [Candidatus Omnitrophica bacterium]|nr:MiaB/RimO family radical SAM methylthiotransferase [Candidatus Omnitrophota bacterium]